MIDSIELTRKGWIKHLGKMQYMAEAMEGLFTNVNCRFAQKDCEKDRAKKIVTALQKLQELFWETGAVCERLDRETVDACDYDVEPRRYEQWEDAKRDRLIDMAKSLSSLVRGIWDPECECGLKDWAYTEEDEDKPTYPGGGDVDTPEEAADRHQEQLDLGEGEAKGEGQGEAQGTGEGGSTGTSAAQGEDDEDKGVGPGPSENEQDA